MKSQRKQKMQIGIQCKISMIRFEVVDVKVCNGKSKQHSSGVWEGQYKHRKLLKHLKEMFGI